ncbi:uncharacterized protein RJT20DRAFT_127066 [Scheffersomyces xylosifermentans]|uniref:uncharacterized protein n=1 Tax=Scheffersomyces xylosifermentans TaxID=1304137 RepID=UPI00315DBFB2
MSRRNRRSVIDDDDDEDFEVENYGNTDALPPRRSRGVTSYTEETGNDFEDEDDNGYTEEAEAPASQVKNEPEEAIKQEETPDEEFKAEDPASDDDDDLASSPSEDEKDNDGDDYVEEDDEDDIPKSRRKRNKGKRSAGRAKLDSDDEDFEDDDAIVSDDDFIEKIKQKNFIESDEEDISGEDYGYGDAPPRKKKKKSRSRSRSIEPTTFSRVRTTRSGKSLEEIPPPVEADVTKDTEEEDDIQKEVADLYDSSPSPTPVKHKLRDRSQKVDYTIPPPITNDFQFDNIRRPTPPYSAGGRGKRGRAALNKNEYRKILFPTAGPFGGSDVTSVFGVNIPPGGIPIPGMTTDNSKYTAIGQNLDDSDSSEDEIVPVNGDATITKKPAFAANGASINNTKLITGGTNETKDGKKKNNLSDTDPLGVDMNIDFSVVGGLDNYIDQLKEMVALPLLYPELYQNFGITPPRGVLFHGPPGTGKTLMARALAASCSTAERKITFFMRKGADCLSKWVGEAERQLRLLFEEAKNQQPAIIFFDEIDGLAPVRSSKQEQIHASIVSTLLALMDGMDNRGQVIVIGATNRPDSIDPALRRPGRFDREFYFPLPDINSRKEILKIHTRKWTPPLAEPFVEKIAELTKGYGGADLRALCTEAALHSIQRKYPQIYRTNEKLEVHPSKVKVIAKDFMKSIEKIVPSSARSTSSGSAPLPDHLKPLLQGSLTEITAKLNDLLPDAVGLPGKKKITALDEALYLDPSIDDEDGGFARQQLLRNLENSRVCKPHLLICGNPGNGQQYVSAAVLNYLEGFQVQSLDMGNIFGDATRTPESSIVQAFIEARRHQPSILFIPNIDIWFQVVPHSARATLSSLLRNLKSNEKVLLLGIAESNFEDLDQEVQLIFGLDNSANNVKLSNPTREQRSQYFSTLSKTLHMKPYEFINDLENRPKRKLKQLKVVKGGNTAASDVSDKKKQKQIEYNDTKLKNVLKIKLAGLMDLFKNRYKRFKKPIIDENFLAHIFDPAVLQNPLLQYEVAYVRSNDPGHEDTIKEVSTGKYYYNMDLDIIEERLWNGFYSEPKQFIKDIKMIVKDCITSGDRERILKANEMLTNAQFGVDDFSTPEFLNACKEMREREIAKQKRLLEEHKILSDEFAKQQQSLLENAIEITAQNGEIQQNGTVVIREAEESSLPAALENAPEDIVMEDSAQANVPETTEIAIVHEEIRVNGSTTDEKVTEIIKNSVVDETSVPQNNGSVSDSESEAEEEEVKKDLARNLIIDENEVSRFEEALLSKTERSSIEMLEIVTAKLMEIIWNDRGSWDKTETLHKLFEAIK